MAGIEKWTYEAIDPMLKHNARLRENYANTDIDPNKTHLNYSFDMHHDGLSPYEYYKKLVDESYIYGRGTKREKDTVMAFGIVVTLPKEIAGNELKEKMFFQAAYTFISRRYGSENIIQNAVHYDEGGMPHLHVIVCPRVKIDHNRVKYKTVQTKEAVVTETGRYEFKYKYRVDGNKNPIPLKNYAKMTDYYDYKFASRDVLNRAELQHFHPDLQAFLDANKVEGRVVNGSTSGGNMTVKAMKEFTRATGLTIEQAKEAKITIENQQTKIQELTQELALAHEKIKDLERTQVVEQSTGWGNASGWGNKEITEEKLW